VAKAKIIVVTAGALLLGSLAWQVGACELANTEFQDEISDIASLSGFRVGLAPPMSDDDLHAAVIEKARTHGISVDPNHITIRRSGTAEAPQVFLAVDYKNQVGLPVFGLTFHFHTTSGKR
jgi:hypothetical protein